MTTRWWFVLGCALIVLPACRTPAPANRAPSFSNIVDTANLFAHRLEIFDDLTERMTALDAEALYVRQNRPERWARTSSQPRSELERARTNQEVGLVFTRLDGTFPSLHAFVTLPRAWTSSEVPKLSVRFAPQLGDRITAINDIPIALAGRDVQVL